MVVGLGLGSVVGWDGYPYGYYGGHGYGDYGYGNGYGQYGDTSHSRVEEL